MASLRKTALLLVGIAIVLTLVALPQSGVALGQPGKTMPAIDQEADAASDREDPDTAVGRRLTEVLDTSGWFENVEVRVLHGVAVIEGTTAEQPHKEWVTEMTRGIDGVVAVVNRIRVERSLVTANTLGVITGSVRSIWRDTVAHTPLIVAGLLVLILTALVSRLAQVVVRRVTDSMKLRNSIQNLLSQLFTLGVWGGGLLVASIIMFPGLTPSKALTVLGLGSVAVGFAFKDIFENFFAGVLILWKYPFDRGDFVECGSIMGKIERITVRMTMIRKVDGQLIVVPNAMLFKNPVDILTNRSRRRATVYCGVAYVTDLDRAGEVIRDAVEQCSTADSSESIEVFAHELADSSINFEITWWTGATQLEIRQSRDEVLRRVKEKLDEAKIEIPFPQRTLWFPDAIRLEQTTEASG